MLAPWWVILAALSIGPAHASGPLHQGQTAEPGEEAQPASPWDAEAPPRPVRIEPEVALPDLDAPATDPPDGSLWQWVDKLEGEIPSEETVRAIQERSEEQTAEMALIDEFGVDVPTGFYEDPAAALEADPLFLDQVDPSEFDIPIVINDAVRKWVAYFTGSGRKYFARWLSRSTRYRPMMYAELERRELPADLVYLSMIESGYNANAYSRAAAAGLWQFIPSTARLYDLEVDWWVDERRDPAMSTDAGLTFLAELHKMFAGDWYLAWAAYNGGPGRVRRATKQAGHTDFWKLAEEKRLHPETRNYVPKIIAAAIVGHHPERYGFTDIDYQDELVYETVDVDGSVELEVLARCAGITKRQLQEYNPALRRWATPPDGYQLRVPVGKGESTTVALADVPKSQRLSFARHKVKRGETLSGIASRYGVGTSTIARANRLANVDRIYVGMTLVVPVPGADVQVADRGEERATDAPRRTTPTSHTVRRGDTLSGVGARYGVSVSNLRSWNGLSGDTIVVGQVLQLKAGSPTAEVATTRYTVKRGDNLTAIAARYGVSASDIQRHNGIRDPSHIEVGQTLEIRLPQRSWQTHSVRAGDSLSAIAKRYGCTVAELREWNDLRSDVIHPGQELRVRR